MPQIEIVVGAGTDVMTLAKQDRDLFFRAEPILELVTVFPKTFFVELIRALADLLFKFLRIARCCWVLSL